MRHVVLLVGLVATASAAQAADDRTLLNHCKALVAQAQASASDNAEMQRCRQVIKEWTLRDSRMSVDEDGRPLR
jgi:SRSO17 transposase